MMHSVPLDLIGWIIIGVMTYVGVNRNRSRRRNLRPPDNRYLNNPPTYRNIQQIYPPTPPPPINYGPGYPINNQPMPGYDPNQNAGGNPAGNWGAMTPNPVPNQYNNGPQSFDPTSAAWPDPSEPPTERVIRATPTNDLVGNSASPTKDIFVWGRNISGWVYAGKLTVVKTLSEREIRQYADGKFGIELQDKLCIEADTFEQARYIFEQSRMF